MNDSTATSVRPAWRTTLHVDPAGVGLLLLRVVLGVVFVGHGSQKLFGWFGGPGLTRTAQFFESAGYTPGKPLAVLSGLAEVGGGLMLVLGIGVSFAGAALVGDMLGAVATVNYLGHGQFFAANHGYELEFTLAIAALAVTLTGAGRISLDRGRPWDAPKWRWALAGVGVVVGVVVMFLR